MADGQVVIEVKLDNSGLDRDLNNTQNRCESFGSSVKAIFTGLGLTKLASKAFDTITGSIGKATARLDSLQKSTKVMGVLTGSTEKATQIVNQLTEAVNDTAYGLDTVSSSTQKLMTSGLDADKSARYITDLMDAVSFYGDGTNETLSNVADGISKMNASQKISADQWQRLTDAGIPVLKIFSEKTGKSMADVMTAFEKGKISADEFNDTLMDALENGTESFPAVAGAAKEMAGSFATSFSNMSARVAIGVANVITSMNNWLSANQFPTLQTMIANVGTVFKTFLNAIAEQLPKALDVVWSVVQPAFEAIQKAVASVGEAWEKAKTKLSEKIDFSAIQDAISNGLGEALKTVQKVLPEVIEKVGEFASFCVEHIPEAIDALKKIAPVLVAIGTAVATWKVIGIITQFANLMKITFLNSIFKVAKAWNVLNAVMAANPIGVVITVIAALVGAFLYLWNTSEDFRNFWIGVWNAVVEAVTPVVDAIVVFFTKTLPQAFDSFVKTAQSVVDAIVKFFTVTVPNAFNEFVTTMSQIPTKIAVFLALIISNVVSWVSQMVSNAVQAGSKFLSNVVNFLTQLPGKVLAFLSQVISNVVSWVSQMIANAKNAGSQFLNGVVTYVTQLPGKVASFLSSVIGNVSGFVSDFVNYAVQAGSQFFNGIVNEVGKIPSQMVSIGSNIVSGIRQGISSAWGSLTSWIGGLASGLVDKVKSALKIGSPSKLFALRVGQWIPPGITQGVKNAMPKALAQMEEQSKLLLGAFSTDSLGNRIAVEMNYGNNAKGLVGSNASQTQFNQTNNFYQEVQSVDEIARDLRIAQRHGRLGVA